MTAARKPPFVRCGCGRLHRSWNPGKRCGACTREENSARALQLADEARRIELERVAWTPEREQQARGTFARWLARQSLDHPWRVATGGGEA